MSERAEGSFSGGEQARKITDEPQFIDAPEHPLVIELFNYLESKRGGREMVDRGDIRPAEIARFMPNMIIAEAVDGGEDFRTRLFGTALVEIVGEERTGKLLSEFAEEGAIAKDKEAVQRRWLHITREAFFGRKPVFTRVPFAASGRLYLVGHTISVPLTAGSPDPAQTIGAMFVTRAEPLSN